MNLKPISKYPKDYKKNNKKKNIKIINIFTSKLSL